MALNVIFFQYIKLEKLDLFIMLKKITLYDGNKR